MRAFLSTKSNLALCALLCILILMGFYIPQQEVKESTFQLFGLFNDPRYSVWEIGALLAVLGIAILGLVYAWFLARQVKRAETGTEQMQKIAAAIRKGADAYLKAQFRKIAPLILVITIVLYVTYTGGETAFRWGRALAFVLGASFSLMVGYSGMKLATLGNLRVAAAARSKGYGEAMILGYRTGTVTGMLTDGLGLLGGTLIFLAFSERAYEALLGFGFGGTLLALFMRVGGGIYTKAADVGADLVGKIEKDIPEDDPRNAATIADNVGDNVGDCAGMSADVFESYEVTIVAAMILGLATFGHKGVIFPLLVRGIGVLGSIISTYTVRAKADATSDTALQSVHRGFWIGSVLSVAGFFGLGIAYLRFDSAYLQSNPLVAIGFPNGDPNTLPIWANFGLSDLDMRPVFACLIGVVLAIVLNKVTSYYTHTNYKPVQDLASSCKTGHATNIIGGFSLGFESAVMIALVLVLGIGLSVMIFQGTPPLFVTYGVAMAGIGMLTLTGNTISMDVFGPVADNANGIGEMGYDPTDPASQPARRILADLDAVGNTTKAETKGIAIGSAVIAAVSLFSSFIAVIAVGSEENIHLMTTEMFHKFAGFLTVADPAVLMGFLIGGMVPYLFSSMLIQAVGRAAGQIVNVVREQFKRPGVMEGTEPPDYGLVVSICTQTAQKELVGPGILAIASPVLVGFLLGPYALGGFLAGSIAIGLYLGLFMANAGGAWDNAKKLIEDGHHGGKGSEAHKAAVTGDTVGDPLKDTAGPAINPLIKVMNMVGMLILGLVLTHNIPTHGVLNAGSPITLVAALGIVYAFWRSKQPLNNQDKE